MRVICEVQDTRIDEVPGVCVTCSRCDHEAAVYGREEASIRRGMVMLRDECPRNESNYYVDSNDELQSAARYSESPIIETTEPAPLSLLTPPDNDFAQAIASMAEVQRMLDLLGMNAFPAPIRPQANAVILAFRERDEAGVVEACRAMKRFLETCKDS